MGIFLKGHRKPSGEEVEVEHSGSQPRVGNVQITADGSPISFNADFDLQANRSVTVVTIPFVVAAGEGLTRMSLHVPNDEGEDVTLWGAIVDVTNQDGTQVLQISGDGTPILVPAGALHVFSVAELNVVYHAVGSDLVLVDVGGVARIHSTAGGVFSAALQVIL